MCAAPYWLCGHSRQLADYVVAESVLLSYGTLALMAEQLDTAIINLLFVCLCCLQRSWWSSRCRYSSEHWSHGQMLSPAGQVTPAPAQEVFCVAF